MLSVQGSSMPSPYNDHTRHPASPNPATLDQQSRLGRKRKADAQDNERLSKRLGRLNLTGPNLRKLYATVEDADSSLAHQPTPANPLNGGGARGGPAHRAADGADGDDDLMQVDDTKHRVFIYNLDDELSSSESEPDDGRIIFLPDIERALLANRIPPVVRADPEGRLAGTSLEDMQLVLYGVPSSLTVAPEHDSVRKAILEARARMREKQRVAEGGGGGPAAPAPIQTAQAHPGGQLQLLGAAPEDDDDAMDLDPS